MRKGTAIFFAAMVAACGGGGGDSPTGTNPATQTPTLDLALSNATVSVQQSATSQGTAVTITRGGGLTSSVDLSVEGAPAGVTPLLTPATLGAGVTSSVLTFIVGSAAAVGTSNITVRAKATGSTVADKTASLALTVTAAPVTGGFTLSAITPSGSIVQGSSSTSSVTVTRSGSFTGPVTLSASVNGSPAGVTASLNPTTVTETNSILTIATTASAVPATYTITISGTGAGVASQSTTVNAVVAGVPTSGTNANWTFCLANAPIWLAVQDGLASWARVTPGLNNDYKFSINSPTGAVAYVNAINGSFVLNILYGTQAEIVGGGTSLCPGGTLKTLSGTFGGMASGDNATASMGGATAGATENSSFTLNSVPGGLQDLVASQATLGLVGGYLSNQVKKIILRRNLNPANNSILPVLDFNAAEAFAPATATLTIVNDFGNPLFSTTSYLTANGLSGPIASDLSNNPARPFYGIPSSRQVAGDLHALDVIADVSTSNVRQLRQATVYFKDLANKTLTLGPVPSAPTVTVAATTPVVRIRSQWSVQSEYNKAFFISYSQAFGATLRTISIGITASYLGGNPATIDHAIPDLSTVAGWDNNWGLRAGTVTNYTTIGAGWSSPAGNLAVKPVEGATAFSGSRSGSFTP